MDIDPFKLAELICPGNTAQLSYSGLERTSCINPDSQNRQFFCIPSVPDDVNVVNLTETKAKTNIRATYLACFQTSE